MPTEPLPNPPQTEEWTIYRCPHHGGDTLEAGRWCVQCDGVGLREGTDSPRAYYEAIPVVSKSDLASTRSELHRVREAASDAVKRIRAASDLEWGDDYEAEVDAAISELSAALSDPKESG